MDSDERVRAELARLADDAESAPEVPPAVTRRVVSALRSAPSPGRSGRRPALRIAAAVGAVAAAAVGAVLLSRARTAVQPTPTCFPPLRSAVRSADEEHPDIPWC